MALIFRNSIITPDGTELISKDRHDYVVYKDKNGQMNQIRYCIGYNQGCYDCFCNSLYDPSIKHITWIRNPGLLEEAIDSLSMTSHPKKANVA